MKMTRTGMEGEKKIVNKSMNKRNIEQSKIRFSCTGLGKLTVNRKSNREKIRKKNGASCQHKGLEYEKGIQRRLKKIEVNK